MTQKYNVAFVLDSRNVTWEANYGEFGIKDCPEGLNANGKQYYLTYLTITIITI